jgi:hypothetical protein
MCLAAQFELASNRACHGPSSSGSLAMLMAIRRASSLGGRSKSRLAHAQRLDHRKLAIANAIKDVSPTLAGHTDVDLHRDAIYVRGQPILWLWHSARLPLIPSAETGGSLLAAAIMHARSSAGDDAAALDGEISGGAVACGSSGCPGRSTLHDLKRFCSVQTGQMRLRGHGLASCARAATQTNETMIATIAPRMATRNQNRIAHSQRR